MAAKMAELEREIAAVAELERWIEQNQDIAAKYNISLNMPGRGADPTTNQDNSPPVKAPVAKNVDEARPLLLPISPENPAASTPIVTVDDLIQVYRSHAKSPFHFLTFKVRASYDGLLKRIAKDIGDWKLREFTKDRFQRTYDSWTATGKLYMAHALVGMVRQLNNFGMAELDNADCALISGTLKTMRFRAPTKQSTEHLTDDHVRAIREEAHNAGWHSMALAQVLQFELKLRQFDVIGEWLPIAEAGASDIVFGEDSWWRGLRWEQLDKDMILHHSTSNRLQKQQEFLFDLKKFPAIMEELEWVGKIPTHGPMIVCEPTGVPYVTSEFRRKWRIVATKAGVPKHVRNTDSLHSEATVEATNEPRLIVERRTGALN